MSGFPGRLANRVEGGGRARPDESESSHGRGTHARILVIEQLYDRRRVLRARGAELSERVEDSATYRYGLLVDLPDERPDVIVDVVDSEGRKATRRNRARRRVGIEKPSHAPAARRDLVDRTRRGAVDDLLRRLGDMTSQARIISESETREFAERRSVETIAQGGGARCFTAEAGIDVGVRQHHADQILGALAVLRVSSDLGEVAKVRRELLLSREIVMGVDVFVGGRRLEKLARVLEGLGTLVDEPKREITELLVLGRDRS